MSSQRRASASGDDHRATAEARRRRWRRLLAVLSASVVASVTVVGGTTHAAPISASVDQIAPTSSTNDQEDVAEGDIQARMTDELILRDEAIRRFDVERAAIAL